MNTTVVLGVGNTLLTDEGAGVHAMRFLRDRCEPLPCTEFIDAGTLSFTLADDIAAAPNLVIMDAAELHAAPGEVAVFEGEDLDDFLLSGKLSVHEVGFADLMDIARLQDCLPQNRALVGIQPDVVDWGERPSVAIQDAIPRAAARAAAIVRKWQAADLSHRHETREVPAP